MSSTQNLTKQADNIIKDETQKVIDQTKQIGNIIKDDTQKVGDFLSDNTKKAKDVIDQTTKNIGSDDVQKAKDSVQEIETLFANPDLSSCLHKTSLFISIILALFAAKFINVVDQVFILNFIFFFTIIYIIYNFILNMLF